MKCPGRRCTTIVTTIKRDIQRVKNKYPSFKVIPLISPASVFKTFSRMQGTGYCGGAL